MKKLILDTSILIDHLRRKDRAHTILAELTRAGYEGAISIITLQSYTRVKAYG